MSDNEDGNSNDYKREYNNYSSANDEFYSAVHSPSYQDQLEGWKQLNAEAESIFSKKDESSSSGGTGQDRYGDYFGSY